jgi:hypothetical protein
MEKNSVSSRGLIEVNSRLEFKKHLMYDFISSLETHTFHRVQKNLKNKKFLVN